jgi:uncharacterized membrane protein (DUF485 family)
MNSTHSDRKRKVKHELWEMTWLFLYLAFFFCALVAYDALLLNEYHVAYWNFGFALLNALVLTKVIMIREYAKLGKMKMNTCRSLRALSENPQFPSKSDLTGADSSTWSGRPIAFRPRSARRWGCPQKG